MEGGIDKDIGVYGGLFLTIISDLRGSSPVWEDFTSKATKLHTSLKSTLTAIAAFLDAFQKVADMATGSRVVVGAMYFIWHGLSTVVVGAM